jgi:hypothetical protein
MTALGYEVPVELAVVGAPNPLFWSTAGPRLALASDTNWYPTTRGSYRPKQRDNTSGGAGRERPAPSGHFTLSVLSMNLATLSCSSFSEASWA